MKKMFQLALFVLGMLIMMPMNADAAKKEKKEKKEYEWTWDGQPSGNADIDAYLVGVDTLWRNMKNLHEQWEQYVLIDTVVRVNGKVYQVSHMETKDGQLVTRGMVNWQFANVIAESTTIVGNSTIIGLQTATATMSLPQLGLKAFSYAKYVKGGPNVIAQSVKEVKAIWTIAVAQAKRWNAMKEKQVDIDNLGLNLTAEQKEKFRKCVFVKEIVEADENYKVITEKLNEKTADELDKEGSAYMTDLGGKEVLPEDKSKSTDNLSDDALKDFQG